MPQNAHQYFKEITLDVSAGIVGGSHTDFVIPLVFSSDTDISNNARADGFDFIVTDATGNTAYEIDRAYWNDSTGDLNLYVKIPTIDNVTDLTLRLYYGDPLASDNASPATCWSGHSSVYLLNSASTLSDRTGAFGDATATGSPQVVWDAQYGIGVDFDSSTSDGFDMPVTFDPMSTQGVVEADFKFNSITSGVDHRIFTIQDSTSAGDHILMVGTTSGGSTNYQPRMRINTSGVGTTTLVGATTAIVAGDENYEAAWFDGGIPEARLYYAGEGTNIFDEWNSAVVGTEILFVQDYSPEIAKALNSIFFDGIIRRGIVFSDVARSAEWLESSHRVLKNQSTFVSIGTEQINPDFNVSEGEISGLSNGISTVSGTISLIGIVSGFSIVSGFIQDGNESLFSSYPVFKEIVLDVSEGIVGGPHTDRVVPIIIANDSELALKARADGYDFIVTNDDGTIIYAYDMFYWDSVAGNLHLEVLIPLIDGTTDLTLRLYYGDSNASDKSNPATTWGSGYSFVYPFNDGSALNDRTGNFDDAISVGTPTVVWSDTFGIGLQFVTADGDGFDLPLNAVPWTSVGALELWYEFDAFVNTDQRLYTIQNGGNQNQHQLMVGTTNNGTDRPRVRLRTTGTTGGVTMIGNITGIQTGEFCYEAAWHNSSITEARLYFGGSNVGNLFAEQASAVVSGNLDYTGTVAGEIAQAQSASFFSGILWHGVFVSNVLRSPEWIESSERMLRNQATFVSVGAEQNNPDHQDSNLVGTVSGLSTVTGTLVGNSDLESSVSGTSAISGILIGFGDLDASVSGIAIVSGDLVGIGGLTGSVVGISTTSATISLTTLVSGTSNVDGILKGNTNLQGVISSISTVDGNIVGTGGLAGSITGASTVFGLLLATGILVGSISGSSNVTAELAGTGFLASSILGISNVIGDLKGSFDLQGIVNGTSVVTGNISSDIELGGISNGTSIVTGTLVGSGDLDSLVAGVSTVSGALVGNTNLQGSVVSASVVNGILIGNANLAGVISGSSTVNSTISLVGLVDSLSVVSATLTGNGDLAGSVSAVSTVIATGILNAFGSVSIISVASVSGLLKGTGDLNTTVANISTISGLLEGSGALAGLITGLAVVTGTGSFSSGVAAISTGSSIVSGSIIGIGKLVGSSVGTSTVLAGATQNIVISPTSITSEELFGTLTIPNTQVIRLTGLNPSLDINGSLNHKENLVKLDEFNRLGERIPGQNGSSALINVVGNDVIVSGLSGMTDRSIGRILSISGSGNSSNDGSFLIIGLVSATTVTIFNSYAVTDGNNGNINWIERETYSLESDLNYIRTDRNNIKGVSYYDSVPNYQKPDNTVVDVPVNLSNIAGKTTDAKTILEPRSLFNIEVLDGYEFVTIESINNLKHADSVNMTGVPIFDGFDINNDQGTYVTIRNSSNGEAINVLAGPNVGNIIFGRMRAGSSASPDSVEIEFRSAAKGDSLANSVSYIWENGQINFVDVVYGYRVSLDQFNEAILMGYWKNFA